MKIYEYKNYEDYVEAQTKANVEKIKNIWVKEATINQIFIYKPFAATILCHGTRNAAEQKYFKRLYPSAEILGTEISHTASNFEMTIQHDFHEVLESHVGKCDIVYSNSFDHSYDPEKSLKVWLDQLNETGSLFLELMTAPEDNKSKRSDPLQINKEEVVNLVRRLGGNVIDDRKTTGGYNKNQPTRLLVIEK